MIIVYCPTKFHAFNLAEQLNERGKLTAFFTIYHEKKNPLFARFNSRVDNENISLNKIHTLPFLSVFYKLGKSDMAVKIFDKYVANQLKNIDFEVIICWAGLSIETVKEAKRLGKKVILERASVHLEEQQSILKVEYAKFGKKFIVNNNALDKEKLEYQIVDFIIVPSSYVKDSFINKGFAKDKVLLNGLGASQEFLNFKISKPVENRKIQIVFFGSIIIRKGIHYLIDAIQLLNKKKIYVDCYIVGKLSNDSELIFQNLPENIKVVDFMPHKELSNFIITKDIAIFPSIEDGYGMVVPQSLVSGLPVIVSEHVGAKDLIEDGVNGFIVPVCNAEAIEDKISYLDKNRDVLQELKQNTKGFNQDLLTWASYGSRYEQILEQKVLIK